MKFCILLFIGFQFFSLKGKCQETKQVTKDRDNYFEQYSVLSQDKRVKHGNYLRLRKLLLSGYAIDSSGQYINGVKEGEWEFYHPKSNHLRARGIYRNGVKDSLWIYYHQQAAFKSLAIEQTGDVFNLKVINESLIMSGKGTYRNDKKVGIWEYFSPVTEEIFQRYDHDQDSLLFVRGKDLNNIEAGFIGGNALLIEHLYNVYNFEEVFNRIQSKISLESSEAVYKFTIDENGRLKDVRNIKNTITNNKLQDRLMLTIQSLDQKWYPKRVNGQAQKDEKTLTFNVIVKKESSSSASSEYMSMSTTKMFDIEFSVK